MRLVICWIGISGYLAACWRALARREGIDLRLVVFHTVGSTDAPFRDGIAAGVPADFLDEKHLADGARVADLVAAHRPDVIVIAGWAVPAFNGLPFDPRLASAKFVMAMDTPRKDRFGEKIRQKLARLKIGRLLSRIDRVMVAGERSWQFARILGFPETQIRRGMYGFDAEPLKDLHARRVARPDGWPRRFLYVGRYVNQKALDVLLAAYADYRRQVADPWPLTCCGSGPLGALLQGAQGVTDRGFVQPPDQPGLFEEHGVFVIASRYEPWGVAIAEAMASGLPAICTEACGAAVELLRPYWNGLSVATDSIPSLAGAMKWAHDNADRLPLMGARARDAALAFSASAWADRWSEMCREML